MEIIIMDTIINMQTERALYWAVRSAEMGLK